MDASKTGAEIAPSLYGIFYEEINHALWDAALVARVHGDGLRALSYTVNDDWAAQRLIALGTDPDMARSAAEQ